MSGSSSPCGPTGASADPVVTLDKGRPYARSANAVGACGPLGYAAMVRRPVEPPAVYLQRDQPEGVPPLHLTGERTLPDVPEENYWYRRHLVVYEWIAARAHGRRVVDLACGEGYGSDVLARSAASVAGVDANPDAVEHERLETYRTLKRKYGDTVEEILAYRNSVGADLDRLAHSEERRAELEARAAQLSRELDASARDLFRARTTAAARFEEEITGHLQD